VLRLEAALGRLLARHQEAGHGMLEALEARRAELAQLEHLPQEAPRRVRDHHGARPGDLLQPRSQVRGLADDRPLLRRALAEEVADDDQAARDADPHRERRPGRRRQPRDGLDDAQPGPDRALGSVLLGLGPAEVGEHAVAHELGDVAAEPGHRARHRLLVRPEDLAHLLRIEPGGKRRGAGQVGEHHRELPPLGLVRPGGGPTRHGHRRAHGRRGGTILGSQGGDRVEQLAPMANGADPDLLQVLRGEARQHLGVDAVLGERPRVPPQTQSLEPGRNLHARPPANGPDVSPSREPGHGLQRSTRDAASRINGCRVGTP
jgi:hypothetical protein